MFVAAQILQQVIPYHWRPAPPCGRGTRHQVRPTSLTLGGYLHWNGISSLNTESQHLTRPTLVTQRPGIVTASSQANIADPQANITNTRGWKSFKHAKGNCLACHPWTYHSFQCDSGQGLLTITWKKLWPCHNKNQVYLLK